jgi:hypothetical protein
LGAYFTVSVDMPLDAKAHFEPGSKTELKKGILGQSQYAPLTTCWGILACDNVAAPFGHSNTW